MALDGEFNKIREESNRFTLQTMQTQAEFAKQGAALGANTAGTTLIGKTAEGLATSAKSYAETIANAPRRM